MSFSKKKIKIIFLVVLVFFLYQICAISQEIRLVFALGTTPISGDYPGQVKYAELGIKGIPGATITVISPGGSEAVMAALTNYEADAGMCGATAYSYVHHTGSWEGQSNPNNIRVLNIRDIAYNPIAVRADSDIYQISDLEGKKVFFGWPGTSCQANTRAAIVEALGIKVDEYVGSLSDGVQAMKDGRIVAFTKTLAGNRLDATHIDIMTTKPLRFIGFNWEELKKIQSKFPWLGYAELPKGWFPSMPPDQEAFIVNNITRMVMCRDDFPEEYAYNWAKSIVENWGEIVALAPSQEAVDPLDCPKLVSTIDQIYLHPGAIRYYREMGIEIPESVIPPEMK